LVIGDTFEKDIQGAIDIGAKYILVPKYKSNGDTFSLDCIEFEQ
jgi:ribonucleotide monophosphatase NagD (HAD superfamily)